MNNLDRFIFRAWLKNEQVMAEEIEQITKNESVQYIKFPKIKNWKENPLNNPTYADLNDVILMQCTGLYDKKGKPIFEGDIVANGDIHGDNKEVVHECIFSEGCFVFAPFEKGDKDAGLIGYEEFAHYFNDLRGELEVIGNIYENPELLEA